ncbi:dienelactone hydrolase family protein [Myxococcota bacterium]|nr:dienelactone hydrolase family protein [Myxococcota bacterium]
MSSAVSYLVATAWALQVLLAPGVGLAEDCTGDGTAVASVTEDAGSFFCTPLGTPPFPGVLYAHGGLGPVVGGELEETCRALAEEGWFAYAPLRLDVPQRPLGAHLQDVLDGLSTLRSRDEVDTDRVAILGFSRGGLLALATAKQRSSEIDATVLMAPASGNGALANALADVSVISAPVQILVASNDLYQDDHVALAQSVATALEADHKRYVHEVYGDYPTEGCIECDGHEMFWVVDDEYTDYWCDVVDFLTPKLGNAASAVPAQPVWVLFLAGFAIVLAFTWMLRRSV